MSQAETPFAASPKLAPGLGRGDSSLIDSQLDEIVGFAAQAAATPFAVLSLAAEDRYWFHGDANLLQGVNPREFSSFATSILCTQTVVIRDSSKDFRSADSSLVQQPPFIRFFAAIPVRAANGAFVATLSVLDTVVRSLPAGQLEILEKLTDRVREQLELRRLAARSGGEVGAQSDPRMIANIFSQMELALASRDQLEETIQAATATQTASDTSDAATTIGNYEIDLQTWQAHCSPSMCRLLGIENDLPFRDVRQFFSKRISSVEADPASHTRESLICGRESDSTQYRYSHPDGHERVFFAQRKLLLGSDGRPTKLLGAVQDITNRLHVEETLRTNEERYRLALDAADLGTWGHDVASDMVTLDSTCQAHWGLRSGQLTLGELFAHIHPDDWAEVRMGLLASYDASHLGGMFTVECRIVRPDRAVRWIALRARVYFSDSEGRRVPLRAIGTTLDITDRKQSDEAMRTAAEMLSRMGSIAKVGGWEYDISTETLRWSDEVYRIHELPIGTPVSVNRAIEYYAPSVRTTISNAVRAAQVFGTPFDLELPMVTALGTEIWVRAQGEAVRRNGRITSVAGAFQDITSQVDIRQAAENSRRRTQLVIDTALDAVIALDDKGRIIEWNAQAEQTFGWSPDEAIGHQVTELIFPVSQAEYCRDVINQCQDREGLRSAGQRVEIVAQHQSGAAFPAEMSVSQVTSEEGERWFSVFLRDISDRKRNEAALEQARTAAEAANRAKSEFLANMSHEIRTPLTAILGYAEMLTIDGDLSQAPKRRVETIHTIRNAGEHLLTVVNDILDLSKIEAGKMVVERIDTDLGTLFGAVISLLRPRAVERGLSLDVIFDSPIPQLGKTDPTRLRQVLMNLVGNSIKFTETGGVTLRLGFEGKPDTDGVLRFSVVDTGCGMTSEQSQRVFTAFTQADSTVTRKHGGTGLGLVICQRLANLMGGYVELTSTELGIGSVFTAYFAIGAVAGSVPIDNLSVVVPSRPTVEGTPSQKLSGRILLAEDGVDNQRLIAFILKKAGAEVDVADNGRLALEALMTAESNGRPYDLLVTDMQMPELDGYALATTLRRQRNPIGIVALTAHAMAEDRDKCLNAGCDDYACKPLDRVALIETCAKWMNPAIRMDRGSMHPVNLANSLSDS